MTTEHEAPAGEDQIFPVLTNPAWPKAHVASMDAYKKLHDQSMNDPDAFWTKVGLRSLLLFFNRQILTKHVL
jgi:hypothetical protein